MAERLRISLATGQRHTQRLPWADADAPEGSASRLGKLDWSVVVLDELTVDLEVSVELRPQKEEAPRVVLLQEAARGRNFNGCFDPETDRRLAGPEEGSSPKENVEGDDSRAEGVEAVIFEFSNAFSWMTGKEVELVALRVRPTGPPPAKVPALRALQPLPELPRGAAVESGAFSTQAVPDLRHAAADDAAAGESELQRLQRFAAYCDQCLTGVEEHCPRGEASPWLQELRERIVGLRGFCQQGPPLPDTAGEAGGDADAAEERPSGETPDGEEPGPAGTQPELQEGQAVHDEAPAEAAAAGQPDDGE